MRQRFYDRFTKGLGNDFRTFVLRSVAKFDTSHNRHTTSLQFRDIAGRPQSTAPTSAVAKVSPMRVVASQCRHLRRAVSRCAHAAATNRDARGPLPVVEPTPGPGLGSGAQTRVSWTSRQKSKNNKGPSASESWLRPPATEVNMSRSAVNAEGAIGTTDQNHCGYLTARPARLVQFWRRKW